ncbi:MAG: hypothetical protein JNJ57_17000 [Saprospiraceae bacterium]|nr:hypothetical protein [Saprospiraceae bacterium]
MAKKRFSEGLDDLFSDSKATVNDLFGSATTAAQPAQERRHGHKNFMSDLDSLLQEALEESLANQTDDTAPVSNKSKSTVRRSDPDALPHGLDALIRQTIDIQEIVTDEASGKKRLTVAVDKTKIEKLKTIARMENAFLKDLLVELIDSYIQEYTKRKGLNI